MTEKAVLELFERAERVHRQAVEELARSRRLRLESEALLQRIYDGLTELDAIRLSDRRARLSHQ
jgi:hypothetical protein